MTQPAYGYPPQQPDPYAQQGYPPPYGQPQPPYQPAPQGYVPPQPGPYGAPNPYAGPWNGQQPGYGVPQQPVQQGARGTLEDYYNQPTTGSGKGLTWKGVPDGYTYVGVVQRTPVDGDLFQDSDPQTKQLKTFRDGSPKLVLPVQLRIHHMDAMQAQTFPDGDARMFLRGALRDEVTRAMAEVGESGVPKAGALVIVTLTGRKPGNNIATNQYAVQYYPAGTWEQNFPQYTYLIPGQHAPAPQQFQQQAPQQFGGAPQQAPYQQQAPAQYAAPAQAAPNPQQYAQPQYGQQAYDPNPQAAPQYAAPQAAPVQANAAVQQPNPQAQQAPAPAQYAQAPAMGQAAGVQPQGNPNTQAPVNQGPAPQQFQQPAAQPQQQVQGQQQLPIPGVNGQAPAGPPPAQPQIGVTGSALDPAKQQLLARLSGGAQPAPQG